MSQFLNQSNAASASGQIPGSASIGSIAPPREINLRERVLEQHQRIERLEQENRELRDGLERLAGLCADQLGLIL